MTPICSFESSAPEAERIWDAGLALYESVSERSREEICDSLGGLPLYCTATLYLTGDASTVRALIEDTLCVCEAGDISEALFTLPLAMEDYLTYTRDTELSMNWIERIEALIERVDVEDDAVREAMIIGAKVVLLRLRSACGLPMQRAPLGQRIARFHTRYYDEQHRRYIMRPGEESLLLTALVAAYGIVADTAVPAVRACLLDHAFELPRVWYLFLYMALYNLEVRDVFYVCLLEGGVPKSDSSSAYLAGIVALVRYVIGVDMGMLGRGIQCATPCMPSYIAYRLSIPAGKQYLCFEGEE